MKLSWLYKDEEEYQKNLEGSEALNAALGHTTKKQSPKDIPSSVGGTTTKPAAENADKAINTKYVGKYSTWSMGGKVFAPQEGSGYKSGDTLGKPSELPENPKNSKGYPVRGEFRGSNPKMFLDDHGIKARLDKGEISQGQAKSLMTRNRDKLADSQQHLRDANKDKDKPEDKTPKTDKKESEWSKMNAAAKAEVIATALQKLDGSKDELHWIGSGWGGIGHSGHSGYVG